MMIDKLIIVKMTKNQFSNIKPRYPAFLVSGTSLEKYSGYLLLYLYFIFIYIPLTCCLDG